MRRLTNLINGLRTLTHKQRVEAELDEELQNYLEESIAHKQSIGTTPEIARRSALAEMGSRNSVKHQVWSSRWESTVDSLLQDLRLSLRTLRKSPAFTAVALLSLAIGIGANTAIFTLIQQVMLRNLPVRDPQQLVTFDKSDGGGVMGGIDLGYYGMFPWYFARQLQDNPGPFQGIASYGSFAAKTSVRLPSQPGSPDGNTQAILVPTSLVSGNFFSLLGAQPLLGRTILPSDDAMPGSGAVVVLSYAFWRQSLSADPSVLGTTITINRTPFTIIGVMPEGFQGFKVDLEAVGLWTPISMQPVVFQQPSLLTPQDGAYFLHLFGRLSPQATTSKAALAQSQQWLDTQVRAGIRAHEGSSITVAREQEINRVTVPLISAQHGISEMRGIYGASLQILLTVVALVLLIACANLANFLLARAATRQREIATRLALGSSRLRIVRQSLIETILLSLCGGALGLIVAFTTIRALIAFVSQGATYTSLSSKLDYPVLLFTFAVSIFTGLLFGIAPAIASSRTQATGALSSNARTAQSGGGRSARFWPKLLVTAQITLSLFLLVGAGLFLRSFRNLQDQDYGFERTHLLIANFDARLAGYKPSQVPALYDALLNRLSAIPGVRSAALAVVPPIWPGNWASTIKLSGYTPAPKENMQSMLNRVSGQYFETVGIPILAGRGIRPSDSATSFKVAVISQALAQHFFPKGDAIGHSLSINIDSVEGPWQIIGIARDTKSSDPRGTKPVRMTYIPVAQIDALEPVTVPTKENPSPDPPKENDNRFVGTVILHTTGNPSNYIPDLRVAFASVDRNLPLLNVITIHDQISSLISNDQLISTLTGIFALLAVFLAAIGLYGVISYNVVRRTNEIGIRFALGAHAPSVMWMILSESLLLLSIGLALGLPLTFATTRIIRQQLFGLTAVDPASFAIAVAIVTTMTIFSVWLPARRATRINPMVALRCE